MAQWRETQRNQDYRTPKPPQFVTTCLKTCTPDKKKGPKRNGTIRENKIGEPRSGPFGPMIGFTLAQILQMQSNEHAATSPTRAIFFAPPKGGNLAISIIQKTHKDFSRRCASQSRQHWQHRVRCLERRNCGVRARLRIWAGISFILSITRLSEQPT